MKRSEIREHVFKLLFQAEFNSIEEMGKQADYFYQDEDNLADENIQQEVKGKLDSILEKLNELDEIIKNNMTGWTMDRIGKIELTVLRLAVYEIKYDDAVPVSVAIDEAVEIAKKFGQDGAGSFVNGVLAKIAKNEE